MEIVVLNTEEEICDEISRRIKHKINKNSEFNLGLATGSTYVKVYSKLVEMNQRKELSFSHIKTFNLDEYVGIKRDHPQSFRSFMDIQLFNHVNINKEHTYFPSINHGDNYDKMIIEHGGIDLQLLGIGENGHIAFNEPGTSFDSRTHIIKLSENTRKVNARFFDKLSDVPDYAVTMGIKTIMQTKEIYITAFGKSKAKVVQHMIEGNITEELPASVLQKHPKVTVFLDKEAAQYIKI